jgi:hypothetical protein
MAFAMSKAPIPIKEIIEKAGGPTKVAEHFPDLTSQAVSQWTRVPENRVEGMARLTGIAPAKIRPDLAERARMFAA